MNSRKNPRLTGYDYSQSGIYFITVCTKDRRSSLSRIVGGDDLGAPRVELYENGRAAEQNLVRMNGVYDGVSVESYVIMPNHVHFLLNVRNGAPGSSPPTNTVSKFVAAFKKFTNKQCDEKLWQRGFYDHVIRDESDFAAHIAYINDNPAKWADDRYYK